MTRTIWLQEEAIWPALKQALNDINWEALLLEDVEKKVYTITSKLLALKPQFAPDNTYLAKSTDPNWYGYRWRIAAEGKYAAWRRYK